MKLKNMSKKIVFLFFVSVIGMILSLGACDGSSPGARMFAGKGKGQDIYAHGQAWHNVQELRSFPGPDGQHSIQFANKGEPVWCFAAGCVVGGAVGGTDMGATTRSAE